MDKLQIRIAKAFLDIGTHANDLDREFSRQTIQFVSDAYYSIPCITNLAFSCELFLKGLLNINFKGKIMGHHLYDLYIKLPEEIKKQLNDNFKDRCKYQVTFEETMKIHDNSFPKFRYIYEKENKGAFGYPDNLQLAAEVMNDFISNIK